MYYFLYLYENVRKFVFNFYVVRVCQFLANKVKPEQNPAKRAILHRGKEGTLERNWY